MAALLYMSTGHPLWFYGFICSLAAATSDTWASELGKLSKQKPFHILTFKTVPIGQSGAITFIGTLAAASCSLLINIMAFTLQYIFDVPNLYLYHIFIFSIIGFLGQWMDTLAGAVFQALYKCNRCGQTIEKDTLVYKRSVVIRE